MEQHHTSIIKVGNSHGVRIPKQFLKDLGPKVVLSITKDGVLIAPDKGATVPPLDQWDQILSEKTRQRK